MKKARKLIVSTALVVGILATSVTAFAAPASSTRGNSVCGPTTSCPTFSYSNNTGISSSNGFKTINVNSSSNNFIAQLIAMLQGSTTTCTDTNCTNKENCNNDCETNCVGEDCASTNGSCQNGGSSSCQNQNGTSCGLNSFANFGGFRR